MKVAHWSGAHAHTATTGGMQRARVPDEAHLLRRRVQHLRLVDPVARELDDPLSEVPRQATPPYYRPRHGHAPTAMGLGLMEHDDIARVAFNTLRLARARGIHDPLRQAHAIAAAIKLHGYEQRQQERREGVRDRRYGRRPIEHGQPKGYYAHLRRDENPCDACRDARNRRDWERKHGRKAS